MSPAAMACMLCVVAAIAEVASADSLFLDGNLILVNPLQSSVIFVAIIISSVVLEALVARIDLMENTYLRITMALFMEEVMVLGLVEVSLLTVNFTISNFDEVTNRELNVVALVLVYMTIAYGIINTCLAVVFQSHGRDWRNFEWGRLEADAQHSSVEGLFKQARRWFVVLLQRAVGSRQTIREVPLVAFSVFISRIERKYLRSIFDITFVSWGGLGVMVVVNLCRSVIVGSSSMAWEVHSFILIVGYGTTVVSVLTSAVVNRRFRRYLSEMLATDAVDRPEYAADSVLVLGSFEATLQTYKVFHLTMLWYLGMFIVVEAKLSYDAHGWYCLLVGIEALLPVVVFYARFPTAVFVPLMCVALGKHVDDDAVEGLKRGCAIDDSSSDGSDLDDEERYEKMAVESGASRRLDTVRLKSLVPRDTAREHDDERIPCDDELEANFGTFHDQLPEDQVPPGEPSRVMGVPPTTTMEKRWKLKPLEPVFL